jgi:hypothetical protein
MSPYAIKINKSVTPMIDIQQPAGWACQDDDPAKSNQNDSQILILRHHIGGPHFAGVSPSLLHQYNYTYLFYECLSLFEAKSEMVSYLEYCRQIADIGPRSMVDTRSAATLDRPFLSSTMVDGRVALRACIINPRSRMEDIDTLVRVVQDMAARHRSASHTA